MPSLIKHSAKSRAGDLKRRENRATVERLSSDSLDVRELKRRGLLQDDRMSLSAGLRWPSLRRIVSSRYWLELEGPETMQRVRVSWTRCHLGGWRPWMHCPYCQSRVAILLNGLGGYRCRPCIGNPLYASQTKSAHGRRHFGICKIRLQLDGMASPIEPFPDRPRGMHHKRYNRMRARILSLEMDLPPKLRGKPVDYRNLAYYAP
jgi:hypothetical protein